MKKLLATIIRSSTQWVVSFCLFAALIVFFNACAGQKSDPAISSAIAGSHFETTVKPLFEHRCVWCHNDKQANAGLNLQNRDTVFSSGKHFVVAGKPEESLLFSSIGRHPQHLKAMPADGWKITDRQARAIRDWISAGAPWPEGRDGRIQKKSYRVDLEDYL